MKLKKVVALVLAAAMTFSLAACGNNAEGGKTDGGKTETGEIEIKLPTYLAGENVGAVFFLPQVERFNKANEGKYKVTIEEVPQAAYADKVKQLAQQKKLPVLVHAPGSGGIDLQWFKQVALANDMVHDLSGYAAKYPNEAARWIPESKDFCTVDGKIVCQPATILRPIGLYYNNTMYSADKDIRDMSFEEFEASLGDNKIAFQTAENGWTSALMLGALIANEEGGPALLNDNVDNKLWDYSDPAFVNAVAKLQKLLQNYASANTVGAAYADAANAFMSKSAAIICNGSWMSGDFAAGSEDKWSNGFTGEQVTATIYPGNVAIANPKGYGRFWIANTASDAEKEAAEAFLAFIDSQEEVEAWILAEGGVAPQVTYSEDFLKKLENEPILYQLAQSMNADTTYVAGVGDILPASVADVEFGKLLPKLIDNTLTAEEFCAELTKKAEEAKQ